jgi:hypothetical protein
LKRYALSLKQPWAALLAHGLKTIEVRRWPTARRGIILIHAARVPDERPEAWSKVPPDVRETAQLLGGIIGEGELTGCVEYRTRDAFSADLERHLNEPSWFEPPKLFGFRFADLKVLPFRPYTGWMRFFEVGEETNRRGKAR